MTEEEYKSAMKRVDELMTAKPGTPEAEELNNLAEKIVAYEDENFPIDDRTCTCIEVYGEDPQCKLHHAAEDWS